MKRAFLLLAIALAVGCKTTIGSGGIADEIAYFAKGQEQKLTEDKNDIEVKAVSPDSFVLTEKQFHEAGRRLARITPNMSRNEIEKTLGLYNWTTATAGGWGQDGGSASSYFWHLEGFNLVYRDGTHGRTLEWQGKRTARIVVHLESVGTNE